MWFHHRLQQQQMAFQLQSLRIQDQPHENASDGARMILPGHLNKLLQIFPSNQVLLLDLRSAVDFQKTHIHGAVNFRVPLTFVQNAPLETVTDAIVDNESRRTFLKWQSSRCVVLYDRHVEFAWECPVADALYRKFRARGWPGQVFILKGYFLEFSRSFEQYIGGDRMTQSGKDYADSLRERVGASFSTSASVAPDYNEDSASYAEWLRLLESEGRVPTTHLVPARKQERIQSVEERQRTIELEFQRHFPILWKKFEANQLVDHTPTFEPGVGRGLSDVAVPIYSPCASSVYGSDDGDSTGDIKGKGKDVSAEAVTARMVEPLAAALEKMREAAESSGGGSGDLGTVSQQLLSTASILDTPSRSNSEAVPPYSPPDPDSKLGGFGLGGSDDGDEDATIATPVKCRSTYLTSSKLEYEGLAGAGVGSGVDEYELVEPTSDDIDDNKPPAYPPRGNRNSQYHHHVGGGRGGHQHQPQQQQQQQRPPFEGDATIGPAAESQRRRAGPIGIVIDRIRRTGRQ